MLSLLCITATLSACAPHPRDNPSDRPMPPSADELFNSADVNHDGFLTKDELKAALPH
jgi:hypothetical protein